MCHFIGWPITEDQLKEAAVHSGILQVEEDFIDRTFRTKCEEIIPYPDRVEPNECKEAFLYLKENVLENWVDMLVLMHCLDVVTSFITVLLKTMPSV